MQLDYYCKSFSPTFKSCAHICNKILRSPSWSWSPYLCVICVKTANVVCHSILSVSSHLTGNTSSCRMMSLFVWTLISLCTGINMTLHVSCLLCKYWPSLLLKNQHKPSWGCMILEFWAISSMLLFYNSFGQYPIMICFSTHQITGISSVLELAYNNMVHTPFTCVIYSV